jgi:hypothetical protein
MAQPTVVSVNNYSELMIIMHHIHAPCSNNTHIWAYTLFFHDIILPENVTLFHIASLFKIEITMPESTNKFKS